MTISNITNSEPKITTTPQLRGFSTKFDLALMLTAIWTVTGVFIDGWAHNVLPETEETFFTPWHGVLYSGYFASAILLTFIVAYNFSITGSLVDSIPPGLGYGLAGVFIFFIGGIGDMLWHTLIGIETDIEALFSPTHLTLMFGVFLIATSILRKALLHPEKFEATLPQLSLVLSAVGGVAIIIFFTQFAHPYRSVWADHPNATGDFSYIRDGVAIMGFVWQTVIMMGFFYYLSSRFQIQPFFMGLYISLPLLLSTIEEPTLYLIPAALASGLVASLIYFLLRNRGVLAQRVMGGLIPLSVFGLYYLNLGLIKGIRWSLELWTGSLVLVALTGLLVSFAFYSIEE